MRLLSGRATGSALVVAILVLFVITALGLAIMVMSATEADVTVNMVWSEMAYHNADAGLEYAKNVLAGYAAGPDSDFRKVLPPPRDESQMKSPPENPCNPALPGCRDYQLQIAQGASTVFIGKVLREANGRLLQFDFRKPGMSNDLKDGDLDNDGKGDIQGTVTVWVRRPIVGAKDYAASDRAVITAEGTAPNFEGGRPGRPSALRRLELTVGLPAADSAARDVYRSRAAPSNDQSEVTDLGTLRTLN